MIANITATAAGFDTARAAHLASSFFVIRRSALS
jgi:hypothetical protein